MNKFLFFGFFLISLFTQVAFAEYQYHPGATYQRHSYDTSGSFDYNRQVDPYGTMHTYTREQHLRTVDQYYVPHSNQNYYQPQPNYYQPQPNYYQPQSSYNTYQEPVLYNRGDGSLGYYQDSKGNYIDQATYRQQAQTYADWANKHGSKKEQRKAASLLRY